MASRILKGVFWLSVQALFSAAITVLLSLSYLAADQGKPGTIRSYKTPEERREAGKKHELFDGVTLAGLLEFEYELQRFNLADSGQHSEETDSPLSLQGALEIIPMEWLKGEVVYEYDFEQDDHVLDEALAGIEIEQFGLEFGKLYLPLGEYFSNFSSGPLIEAAESRGAGIILSYEFEKFLEFSPFVFYPWSVEQAWIEENTKWGLTLEQTYSEFIKAGVGYISSLQGAAFELENPEQEDEFADSSAINGFLAFDIGAYGFSFEYFSALESLQGFEEALNRPRGWNFEASRLLDDKLTICFRLEGSEEIEEEPFRRIGFGLNFKVYKDIVASLELLRGTYRAGLAEDRAGEEIDSSHLVVGQLSVEL